MVFWGLFSRPGEDRGYSNSRDKTEEDLISDFNRQMPGPYNREAKQSYSGTPGQSKHNEQLSPNMHTKAPEKARFCDETPNNMNLIDFDSPCPSVYVGTTYAKQSDQITTVANSHTRGSSTQGYYNPPEAQQPYYQTLEADNRGKAGGIGADGLVPVQKIGSERALLEKKLESERTEKKLQQAIEVLKETSEKSHMEIEGLKRALAELKVGNEALKEANENLKDRIFTVQPVIQFSDSQIGEKYHLICSHIEDWIENEIPDLGGVVNILTRHIVQTEKMKLLMDTIWGTRDWELLRQHPEAEFSILRRIIHLCLELWIFDKGGYLVGINRVGGEMLAQIEQGMRALEPRVDEENIQLWRSNSLRALATVPNYIKHRDNHLRRATSFVATLLEPLFHNNHNVQTSMNKFHARVTVLAAELMMILRTNPDKYYFNNRSTTLAVNREFPVRKKDLESLVMIDVQTDQAMKTMAFRSLDDETLIGWEIVVIHPALVREAKGDNPDIVIHKPVCLVKLDKGQQRRSIPGVPLNNLGQGPETADQSGKQHRPQFGQL